MKFWVVNSITTMPLANIIVRKGSDNRLLKPTVRNVELVGTLFQVHMLKALVHSQ